MLMPRDMEWVLARVAAFCWARVLRAFCMVVSNADVDTMDHTTYLRHRVGVLQ